MDGEERGEEIHLLEEIEKYTGICNGMILLRIFHDMVISLHTIHPQIIDVQKISLRTCDLPCSLLHVPTTRQAPR